MRPNERLRGNRVVSLQVLLTRSTSRLLQDVKDTEVFFFHRPCCLTDCQLTEFLKCFIFQFHQNVIKQSKQKNSFRNVQQLSCYC